MRFNLDNYFGLHQQGMLVRSKRAELIASNLANADTPHYQARDIDFREAMKQAQRNTSVVSLKATNKRHINNGMLVGNQLVELQYRNPKQASLDGNTVDTQVEKAEYAKNAIQYQASLRFLSGKIKSLKSALKGE